MENSFRFDPRAPFVAGKSEGSHLVEVWLNGYREPLAVAADPVEGWVERYEIDREGRIVQRMGQPVIERVRGRVQTKETRF